MCFTQADSIFLPSTTKNVEKKNGVKQLDEDFIGLQGGFSPLAYAYSGKTRYSFCLFKDKILKILRNINLKKQIY